MSLELMSKNFGHHFIELSHSDRLAVMRYVDRLVHQYPEFALEEVTAGPGNEGVVYVYMPLPQDEDLNIELHENMAEVAMDVLLETGVSIALMPVPE